jgi:hypothetical protein
MCSKTELTIATYRREWTEPYGLMVRPAFGLLSRRYEAEYGLDYRMLGKLAVTSATTLC